MFCQKCGKQIDDNSAFCQNCGSPIRTTVVRTTVQVQPTWSVADRLAAPVGRTGLSIAAGYLGLFSFIPFLGIIAIIVGIAALNNLSKHPDKHGHGRAWVGIILGAISTALYAIVFAAKL